LDIALILTNDKCVVCADSTIGSEIILDAPDGSPGEWVMWNLVLVRLETVLVSLEYRCMVCPKRTMGSEIILDAPGGTPRSQGSSGSSFWSVWRQC
jgi:hypothetical protein